MGKINQKQAQEIIDKFIQGKTTKELSEEYNLWTTSICNLIRGHSWQQCKRPENIKELINKQHPGRSCKHCPDLTSLQKEIIIGSLLGDGNFIKTKNIRTNSRFTKTQSLKRKEYIFWHHEIFKEISNITSVFSDEKLTNEKGIIKRTKQEKYLSGYRFSTIIHPTFTEFRNKWYPNGTKIIPSDLVLTPQIIAIWYFDDGSNSLKNRTAYFCTNSFTIEEVEFLSNKLNEFNISSKIITIKSKYDDKEQPMLKVTKSSYDNLISLVKPFVLWDCLKYKTNWRPAKKQWERSKLSEKQVKEILHLKNIKSYKEIAKMFDVCENAIYKIMNGINWKHLHSEAPI